MKAIARFVVSLVLILAFLSNAMPCGPGWVSPVFDYTKSPEYPYRDYAAGRLGVIKPEFHRSVLFAAYRYLGGGSFSPDEQRALVEYWKADIDRDYAQTDEISPVVKAWVAKRKEIVGKEEKTPEIYVERSYGGYDFFPNCTQNAFEVATETLSDRSASHGPSDPNVIDWVKAQDQVFANCASGKTTPDNPDVGAPVWMQKDRAYQKAAAEFYSLDYAAARRHFAEIAQDTESPWAETADYLVARTLIRQASLTKSPEKALPFYEEAEDHLQKFVSRSGKFSASAERMIGLIKYRIRPKERVVELAQQIAFQTGNDNFKQDLIDYNWLLDKFEGQALAAEEKRKREEEEKKRTLNLPACGSESLANALANTPCAPVKDAISVTNTDPNAVSAVTANTQIGKRKSDDDLEIQLYSTDYTKNWTIYVTANATDVEALAEAEKVVGSPLSDELKKNFLEQRKIAYAGRYTDGNKSGYERDFYGEEKLTPSLMPDFLRHDAMTDWLFTYQMPGAEAYLYSLSKFKTTGADLWLMTALSKADRTSTGLPRLLEAANNASRTSPAYLTIAYNTARIYIETGKSSEAKKLIDAILDTGDDLAISSRNQFLGLRLRLAETLDDFLTNSLRRPYAWDFSGSTGSIDDLIAEQKTYFDPEYNKEGREAFDQEVEGRFEIERLWQDRVMLDTETIGLMNQSFPASLLMEVERSPALPDYLRPKFAIALWTRAFMLNDLATLEKMTPEVIKYQPEFAPGLSRITNAKTPAAKQNAALFFVLQNPLFSPFVEDGMGKTDNEFGNFDGNDWWCAEYLSDGDAEAPAPGTTPRPMPKFLTAIQKQAALAERKKLIDVGDAPKYLAGRVIEWARRSPADRRVPEALYIVHQANGWTKYGCGNDEDLHTQIAAIMKKRYPNSEWTAKLNAEESEK